jgi:PleD family two-component response regulator
LDKGVVDYLIKENPSSIDLLLDTIKRLYLNQTTTVMVVDDSNACRAYLANLLKRQQLKVIEAEDGARALDLLKTHQDVRLVITNYTMPKMDGYELTCEIRRQYSKEVLAIIGMSAQSDNSLLPRFLKGGADDFISIPLSNEEFNCRIAQRLNYMDTVQALRDAVIRDELTGLYNRRHLMAVGNGLFNSGVQNHQNLAAAMIDVDYFKQVNDPHGHDAGDAVLKRVAK